MRINIPVIAVLFFLSWTSTGRADSVTQSIREFTAKHAPEATAAQAKEFGLFLPDRLDPAKPLVVLVHGLDMGRQDWNSIAKLLNDAGKQVALFSFPEDQPIDDDVKLLSDKLTILHRDHPDTKTDLVAFSMGSLVCRGYVEGKTYAGGVDRMILLSPPNHGSSWARFGIFAKCKEQFEQATDNKHWQPSWFITSGLCEADDDLLPGSSFLEKLNAQPRRSGVRYTIVKGDEHVVRRMTADCLICAANSISSRRWGAKRIQAELKSTAADLNAVHDRSDGPVKLTSADLDGVTDIVRLHADHETMIQPHNGQPPAAWDVLKERLAE